MSSAAVLLLPRHAWSFPLSLASYIYLKHKSIALVRNKSYKAQGLTSRYYNVSFVLSIKLVQLIM